MGERKRQEQQYTWTCEECLERGEPSHCIRPGACFCSQESLIMKADVLLEMHKEGE